MVESVVGGICRRTHILVMTTDNLDPVTIRILGEGNVLHATISELLLERIASTFNSLAGRFDIVNRDGNVTKAAMRFRVSVGYAVIGVILCAIVVGELQNSVAVRPVTVTLQGLRAVVCEEVEGKLVIREIELLNLSKSEELVEFH